MINKEVTYTVSRSQGSVIAFRSPAAIVITLNWKQAHRLQPRLKSLYYALRNFLSQITNSDPQIAFIDQSTGPLQITNINGWVRRREAFSASA